MVPIYYRLFSFLLILFNYRSQCYYTDQVIGQLILLQAEGYVVEAEPKKGDSVRWCWSILVSMGHSLCRYALRVKRMAFLATLLAGVLGSIADYHHFSLA